MLQLAKRMQVYVAKHMETMKTIMLDTTEFIKSSLQTEGSAVSIPGFQDLIWKETKTAIRKVVKELLTRHNFYPSAANAPAVLPTIGEIFQSSPEQEQCLQESESEIKMQWVCIGLSKGKGHTLWMSNKVKRYVQ